MIPLRTSPSCAQPRPFHSATCACLGERLMYVWGGMVLQATGNVPARGGEGAGSAGSDGGQDCAAREHGSPECSCGERGGQGGCPNEQRGVEPRPHSVLERGSAGGAALR
eukprot:2662287-Rhodomonas_salina.1